MLCLGTEVPVTCLGITSFRDRGGVQTPVLARKCSINSCLCDNNLLEPSQQKLYALVQRVALLRGRVRQTQDEPVRRNTGKRKTRLPTPGRGKHAR